MSTSPDIAISEPLNVQSVQPSFEPDNLARNPPWSLLAAVLTWIASVVLLFLPQVFALPYVALHYRGTQPTLTLIDKTVVLILIAGVLRFTLQLSQLLGNCHALGKFSSSKLRFDWNGKLRSRAASVWRSSSTAQRFC